MKRFGLIASIFLMLISNLILENYNQQSFIYNGRFLSNIIEALIFNSFGMKKHYSDILYIRMLQYYGKKNLNIDDYLAGDYPLMYYKVRDIAITNPTYLNSIILGTTIIAFGLYKTVHAKSIINMALLSGLLDEPIKIKYLMLIAAIITYESNKKNFIDDKTISLLYETAIEIEHSDMFKNIVAFLCLKNKRRDLAISLYFNILKTSNDDYYRNKALNQLKILGVL
ncbi:MAG: hypothetical protein N2Z20_01940 [Elusimicrobiales bacterium]|nr:hypothetical protein [Elusimicrobiales bacterium]